MSTMDDLRRTSAAQQQASAVPSRDSVSAAIALVRAKQQPKKTNKKVLQVHSLPDLKKMKEKHHQQQSGVSYNNLNLPSEERDPLVPVASRARGRDPSVTAKSSASSSSSFVADGSGSGSGSGSYGLSARSSGSGSSSSDNSSKMLEYLKRTTNPVTGIRGVKTPQTSLPIPGAPSLESEESGIDDPEDVETTSSRSDPSDQSSSAVSDSVVDEQTISQVNAFLDKLKIGPSGGGNNSSTVQHKVAFLDDVDDPDAAIEKLRALSSSSSSGGASEDSSAGEIQPETLDEISAFIDALSEKGRTRLAMEKVATASQVARNVIDKTKTAPPTPETSGSSSDILAAARAEARKLATAQANARNTVCTAEEVSRGGKSLGGDAPAAVVMQDVYDDDGLQTSNENFDRRSEVVAGDEVEVNKEKREIMEREEQLRTSRPSPIYEILNPVRHSDPPTMLAVEDADEKADPPEEDHEDVDIDMTVEEALARSESFESEDGYENEFSEEKKWEDADEATEDAKFDREAHLRSTIQKYANTQHGGDDDDDDEDEQYGNTNFVDTSFAASLKKNLSTVIEAAASAETDVSEPIEEYNKSKEDVGDLVDELDDSAVTPREDEEERGLALDAQNPSSLRHMEEELVSTEHDDEGSNKEPVGTYQRDGVEVELAGVEQTIDEFKLNKGSLSTDESGSQDAERYATVEDDSQFHDDANTAEEQSQFHDNDDDATSTKSYAHSETDSVPWALKDIASEDTMKATGRTRRRFVVSGPRPSNKSRNIVSLLSYDSSVQPSEAPSEAIEDESHVDEQEAQGLNVESQVDDELVVDESNSGDASPSGNRFGLMCQAGKFGFGGDENDIPAAESVEHSEAASSQTSQGEHPDDEDSKDDVLLFESQSDGVEIVKSFKSRDHESDDEVEKFSVDSDNIGDDIGNVSPNEPNPFVRHDPSGNLGHSADRDEMKPDPDALNANVDEVEGVNDGNDEAFDHVIDVEALKMNHDSLQVETVHIQDVDNHTDTQALSPGGILPFASSPIRKRRVNSSIAVKDDGEESQVVDEDDEMVAAFLQSGSAEESVTSPKIGMSGSDSASAGVVDVTYNFVHRQPIGGAINKNEAPHSFLEQFDQLGVETDAGEDENSEPKASIPVDLTNEDSAPTPAFEMGAVPLSPTEISEFFGQLDKQEFKEEEQRENVQRFQQLIDPLLNGHKPTIIETAQIRQAAKRADVPLQVVDEFIDHVNFTDPSLDGPVGSTSKDDQEELLKKWDEIEDLNEDAAIAAFLSRFGDRAEGELDVGEELNIFPTEVVPPVDPTSEETSAAVTSPPRLGARPMEDTAAAVDMPEDLTEVDTLESDFSLPTTKETRTEETEDDDEEQVPKNKKSSAKMVSQSDPDEHSPASPRRRGRSSTTKKDLSIAVDSLTIDQSASFVPQHADNDVWRRRAAMASYGWGWEEATWLSPKHGGGVMNQANPGGIDGVAAVEGLSSLMFNKNCFPFANRNWKLSYEDRIQSHRGYFDIQVHSLQEAAAFGDGEWPQDETPWELRQVRQRFLYEKSVAFSRNWFGSFEMVRGNDKIKAPVCKPKSMEMPMENVPDPGDWTEEWYTTWKNGQRPSTTETDGSGSYSDDESHSNATDSFSTRMSSDDDEDDDDVWEEAPECGTFVNVRQKIGERITRVHPDYTSSLRRSRWRKKYFPKGSFPYAS